MNAFEKRLNSTLQAEDIAVLQVNVGLKCNQACTHCHLQCSPDRTESMTWETMEKLLGIAKKIKPALVDITGGAPELNPNLKKFIERLKGQGHTVQSRTNFTAMTEDCCQDMPEFFCEHDIKLIGSLPCYLNENVCKMRGAGVFDKSIQIIQRLNSLGYASDSGPELDLVFNHPLGPYLPPDQCALEQDYKRELGEKYNITFSNLLTITNIPIGRYMQELKSQGQDQEYMDLLMDSFNEQTVEGLMCRHQINVGWDGVLYDCDFNQALHLPIKNAPAHVDDFDAADLSIRDIVTGPHCFGCTAGAGSSCGGALA